MQVAKILKCMIIVLSSFLSCKKSQTDLYPNNNAGGYTLAFHGDMIQRDSIFINGYVFDIESKEGLEGSFIHFYCESEQSNRNGYFEFNVGSKLDSDYFFKATSIGYKMVVTNFIRPIKSDTLKLNFYLQKDETPIYHCN